MDRGHSEWTVEGVTWTMFVILTAPDEVELGVLRGRVAAVALTAGASWVESRFVCVSPEQCAHLVRRVVDAIPDWAADARAVADSCNQLRGARLFEKYGAVKERWHEADRVATADDSTKRDVLDAVKVEEAADTSDSSCAAADLVGHAWSALHYFSEGEGIIRRHEDGDLDRDEAGGLLTELDRWLPVPTVVFADRTVEFRLSAESTRDDLNLLRRQYRESVEDLHESFGVTGLALEAGFRVYAMAGDDSAGSGRTPM